ncbi:Guanine nucleotide-exchange factor SEC12 [Hanseniaspora opuntiae]|uniref:Guanine nucleotide-exchange factor SEC12 n=1 Tax=Hanseniaspora opuntiae TaxID=211096 RepID=A0A1E5R672_9ASCO|nr:Guanine nucleotide-exchange factor SEC12 [Hanseniaspora opuntiae]
MKVEVLKSNLKYPLYACKFIADDLLLVTGGGGEGNNGIDNKITLLSIENNKIKKFRELKLSDDSDSPTCMDFAYLSPNIQDSLPNSVLLGSDDIQDIIKVDGVFLLGCNENSNKIMQSNINNSLQRFNYENQHIRFIASVDYDQDEQTPRDLNTYLKFLKISDNIEFAACCTSKVPSVIRIINPITLNELYEIETGNELRDFDFQKGKQAKILSYITKSTCELISCVTGTFITKSYHFDVNKYTPLKLVFIKEDCFFIILKNDISNKFELHLFSMTGEIKLLKIHELKNLSFKGITSVDYSSDESILAISGNDNSVNFFHLYYKQANSSNHSSIIPALSNSKLKFLKKFSDLHTFAITKIAFNQSGSRLSTVSADNSVSVINIPKNFKKHKPTTKKFLSFLFKLIILVGLCIIGKFVYENDLHIYTKDALLDFNEDTFQPLMKDKVIPFVKEKINRNKNVDSEYFKFKSSQDSDDFDQVTILSKDSVAATSTKPLSYSTTSTKKNFATSDSINHGYYDQVVEDDDAPIAYDDYLQSLNDIVSIDVTTPGYESQVTQVVETQAAEPSEAVEDVVEEEPVEESVEEEPVAVAEDFEEEPVVVDEEVTEETPDVDTIVEEEAIVADDQEVNDEDPIDVVEEETPVSTVDAVEEETPVVTVDEVEEPIDDTVEPIADDEEDIEEVSNTTVEEVPEESDKEREITKPAVDEVTEESIVDLEYPVDADEEKAVLEESPEDFKIQTVPNVEEDVEEILKATPTKQVEEPKVSIQTAPNVEEDIEEILIVSTVTSTQDTPVATETQLNVKSTTDSEDGALESKGKEATTVYEEDYASPESIDSTVGELEDLPTETDTKDRYDHDRASRVEELLPKEVDVHLPTEVEDEQEAAAELLSVENQPESKESILEEISEDIKNEPEATIVEESVPTEDLENVEEEIDETVEKLEEAEEYIEKEIEEIEEHEKSNSEARASIVKNNDSATPTDDLNDSLDALYEENEKIEEELALDEL